MPLRFERLLRRVSLRAMLLVFLLTSLLFVAIAVYFTERMADRQINEAFIHSVQQYAKDETSALGDNLTNMRNALFVLANKVEIQDYIKGDDAYKFDNAENIVSALNDVLRYVPQITNVCVTTQQGQVTESLLGEGLSIGNYISRQSVMRRIVEEAPKSFMSLPLTPGYKSEFLLALAVPISGTDGYCVSFSTADDLLSNLRLSDHPYIISDGENLIISSELNNEQIRQMLNTSQAEFVIGNATYTTGRLQISRPRWQIDFAYPLIDRDQSGASNRIWSAIYLIIFAINEVILGLMIYGSILNPIRNIHEQTLAIRIEDGRILNPVQGENELNALALGINDMIQRTNEMGQEMARIKVDLVQAELEQLRARNMFLQAQINPHFLYNMLECLCGMAAEERAPLTREMSMLLAKLFRYYVDRHTGTLEDEIDCVSIYAKIIGLRYDEAYEICVDVPEELFTLEVPRMILQPVVENAIQHGFTRGNKQKGTVEISASNIGEKLFIAVNDDGAGMNEAQIELMNESFLKDATDATHSNSIGLHNVNSRLKLQYGNDSGLKLASNTKGGLNVTISIGYYG